MTRRFSVLSASTVRALIVVFAASLAALVCAGSAAALTFTPGDPVVFRAGTTSETLATKTAAAAFFDEFEPNGNLAGSVALPTTVNGANRRLTVDGSGSSEGLLTLSGNDEFLFAVGYNAPLGTKKVSELKSNGTVKEEEEGKAASRVVARVSKTGEVNTETALTDFANGNNARSATSQEGVKIWLGGAGKSTSGGVHFTELKKTTSTVLNNVDSNVRQVEVVDGQLYTSADPTKNEIKIAKVGTGEPISGETNTISNLPFETETAPKQPYAFSMLTLGLGSEPDTIYVADGTSTENAGRNAIVKYCLKSGKWVEEGAVEVPFITGVAARDTNGIVTIYATTGGEKGLEGHLYKLTDVSGFGGMLAGVPQELYATPTNEGFRGVAFAPGTTFETGGTPPPAPTISVEKSLAAAMGDPTNPTAAITIGDSGYAANELTVAVHSANQTVAPQANINVTGSGKERTLHVTPAAVGESKLTVTVEAPNGVTQTAAVQYGASPYEGNESDRYYDGAGNASTEIDVGGGYMIAGDDENNILRLYHERHSGEPVKTYNFTNVLPFGSQEMDIESSARAGNMLYWMGSLANSHHGEPRPATDVLFATKITGSGANTELTYVGSYTHLREDIVEWDSNNGNPLGLSESAKEGSASDLPTGFNVEGLEFAAGSEEEAYIGFRAPIEPTSNRTKALVIPVKNLGDLVKHGNPGLTKATFGSAMEWNLSEPNCAANEPRTCLGIREIRKNAEGEYLIIAGQSEETDTVFALYGWDGNTEDEPVKLNTEVPGLTAEGAWEGIVSVPEPITNGSEVELVEDNGDSTWYESGLDSKNGLAEGLQKDLGRLFTIEIPAPGPSGPPHLQSGTNPNSGKFSIRWKPAPTLRARFLLQHQNAEKVAGRRWAATSAAGNTTSTPRSRARGTTALRRATKRAKAAFSARIGSDQGRPYRAPRADAAPRTRTRPVLGQRRLVQEYGDGLVHLQRRPETCRRQRRQRCRTLSLTPPKTYNTSGSFEACGTVEDKVKNKSAEGCVTVQVDATSPTLEITCPATAVQGESVSGTVTASDGQSGLAQDPTGTVPINTANAGPQTITRTAIDNVGHETTKSCTTEVVYPTPGAPMLTGASNPNNGNFKLTWTGPNPGSNVGLTYTLQQRLITSGTWTTWPAASNR